MAHWLHKFRGTVAILTKLGMARMFGQYEHSAWNGEISYARYRWRGETWIIPTGPVETEYRP